MLVLTADTHTLDSIMVPKLDSPVISADGIFSEVIELIISVLSLSYFPVSLSPYEIIASSDSWNLVSLGSQSSFSAVDSMV